MRKRVLPTFTVLALIALPLSFADPHQPPPPLVPAAIDPSDIAELPDGFSEKVVATGITGATAMVVAADGRVFVCEQTGAL